jgi:general secretion pathway protein E
VEILLDTQRDQARRDPIATELTELGMGAATAAIFREAVSGSNGLLLFAGGAGSGRTTTLNLARRIRGPRAAVAVDDISDRPSAKRALDAALEGRFVLATIDAGGAVDAITRLRKIWADPFQLGAGLRAAFGQRLVRRLCPSCREPVQASRDVSARLGFDPGMVVYRPVGCATCRGSGFQGQVGLYEAIQIGPAMRRLIERGDAAIIAGQAFRSAPDLAGAARAMIQSGRISADDALSLPRIPDQLQ